MLQHFIFFPQQMTKKKSTKKKRKEKKKTLFQIVGYESSMNNLFQGCMGFIPYDIDIDLLGIHAVKIWVWVSLIYKR